MSGSFESPGQRSRPPAGPGPRGPWSQALAGLAAMLGIAVALAALQAAPPAGPPGAESAPLELTLGDNRVAWSIEPHTELRLRLQRAGVARVDLDLRADRNGRVAVRLVSEGQPLAIRAGDRISIEVGGETIRSETVPALTAHVDPDLDRVSGQAPPGAALRIAAAGEDGPVALARTADSGGRYLADFRGRADLSHRRRVTTTLAGAGLISHAPGRTEQLTTTLESARLLGDAVPGTWIGATLSRGADGAERRGFGEALAGEDGRFALRLLGAEGTEMRVAPGDRLLASFGFGGASSALVLPALEAVADPTVERVTGLAWPGQPVWVRFSGHPDLDTWIRADAEGGFALDLAGQTDLAPGSAGEISIDLPRGHTVVLPWAAPRITLTLGSAEVAGLGPSGRALSLGLVRAGQALAGAQGRVEETRGAAGAWRALLADGQGRPVAVRPGDRLAARIGDQALDLELPELWVEANPFTDRVNGAAPPGQPLRIRLRRGEARLDQGLAAGPDGRFMLSLEGRWDLRPNDLVRAWIETPAGADFVAERVVPGLDLDLDRGEARGHAEPFAVVRGSLGRPGEAARAEGSAEADAEGAFVLRLQTARGAAVLPLAGERLAIAFAGQAITMTVPSLTVAIDAPADRVTGTATPGGSVALRARQAFGGRITEAARQAPVGQDGAYALELAGDLDLAAGTELALSYQGADGHRASRRGRLPILHLQRAGDFAAGFVAPGAAISLTLRRGGQRIAESRAQALDDGAFDAFLSPAEGSSSRHASTAPAAASGATTPRFEAGDRVELAWWDGDPGLTPPSGALAMPVAPISATLDPAGARLTGRCPPGAALHILVDGGAGPRHDAICEASGRFSWRLAEAGPLAAGLAVETGTFDAEGQRSFVRSVAPRLELTLGRSVVEGLAEPLAGIRLDLAEGSGAPGRALGMTDSFGRFALALADIERRAVMPAAGQVITLTEPGGRRTGLRLPSLTIRVDLDTAALVGSAAPLAPVDLLLHARGRPGFPERVWADAGGTWRLAEASLPGGLRLVDLDQAEASVRLAPGHRVRALAIPKPSPSPEPSRPPSPTPSVTRPAGTASAEPGPTQGTPESTPSPAPGARAYLPSVWQARSR